MSRKNLAILLTAVFALGGQLHAEQAKKAKSQGESKPRKQSLHEQFSGAGYGIAGCGLGSIIFGTKPGKIQIVSATSNHVGGNQTFGMSSGTSNCDIPEMGQQAAVYIEVNKEIVKKDAARGNGDTLAGLSDLLKCHDQDLFDQRVHENFEKIFSEGQSSYGSVREILKTIKGDQALAASCDVEA